jgi:hypothetical protein
VGRLPQAGADTEILRERLDLFWQGVLFFEQNRKRPAAPPLLQRDVIATNRKDTI